ncbi:MAG TPA: class I SAM-dependent methyltransferase [Clostridia bacterium]|nr:class I SAM-dependent methyltransferase [Clostridia bacterium]
MYESFAYIYDEMMLEVNYQAWVAYIENIFCQYAIDPKVLADLACGTGNITIPMAERGYNIIGVDRSEDMLLVAQEKARKQGLKIPFVCQDIRDIDLHKSVDAVLVMCDGINYILEDRDLDRVFSGIYNILKPGGILIFDISSYYKLSTVLGNNTIADNDQDISLIWQNHYDHKKDICTMDLTFFVEENSLYRRFDEVHIQKAYGDQYIIEKLKYNKYCNINSYDDLSFNAIKCNSQRIFFVAQRQL